MLQVGTECHLVLLLCLLDVAVEHLNDGILTVHIALVVLGNDLNVLLQRLHLRSLHHHHHQPARVLG